MESIDNFDTDLKKEYIVDGMFDTKDLMVGEILVADTGHHKYRIEKREDGLYVSGHEKYCPTPTKLDIFAMAPKQSGKGPEAGIIWTGSKITFMSIEADAKFTTTAVESIERNP